MKKRHWLSFFLIFIIIGFVVSFFIIWNNIFMYKEYTGEHPHLYTEAIHSLLWTYGHSTASDKFCNSEIEVIEEDEFGRVLFEYNEKFYTGDLFFSSLLIMQAKDENYVYYYEDYNFICEEREFMSKAEFYSDDIDKLKEQNDWNKDLDLTKCIKKELQTKKKELKELSLNEKKLDEIFSEAEGYRGNKTVLLTEDGHGNFICYTYLSFKDKESEYGVIIFKEDLTYFYFQPNSFYNYQLDLKQFKDLMGWQS